MFNLFIEDVLSKEQCELLIERGLHTDLQTMYSSKIVNGEVVSEGIEWDGNKRKGSYYIEDDIKESIFIKLTDTLVSLLNGLKIFNGVEYTHIEKYTFNQYESGDFLDWHKDSHEVIYGATSTIIIQLNDNYEGGDVMYNINQTKHSVPKKQGSIFVFDSNIEHSVNKVESGIRYSMNAWPSSKLKKRLL